MLAELRELVREDVGAFLHPSSWLWPVRGACGAEKGRGPQAQLCLENSSPDVYDYDGPSLVDLLWNINKLNRLQKKKKKEKRLFLFQKIANQGDSSHNL